MYILEKPISIIFCASFKYDAFQLHFSFLNALCPLTFAIVVLGNGSNNKLYHTHLRLRGNRNAKVMRTRKLRGIPSCVSLRGKAYIYLLSPFEGLRNV